MWIRTQDKKMLGDFNAFNIQRVYNGIGPYRILGWSKDILAIENGAGDTSYQLGVYSTEERALQVLEAIQYKIIKGTKLDEIISGVKYQSDFVFEMPAK